MDKHSIDELHQWQALPLSVKIRMTEFRIKQWYEAYDGDIYVSFSGGKDSTVLADIVHNRLGLTDVPLVFVDTGLEYPEIREFVKGFGDKATWLKPKMSFKQVCDTYGYPFISKEVSEAVYGARRYLKRLSEQSPDSQKEPPYGYFYRKVSGLGEYAKNGGGDARLQKVMGTYPSRSDGKPKTGKSSYSCEKYKFFLDADFEISNICCKVMKKNPAHKYAKETGRHPMTAQMASESRLRTQAWLKNGCNGFDMKTPISNPMAFWTEQDVLLYIKMYKIPIASVYGDVVEDISGDEVEGQLTMSDVWAEAGIFDAERPLLKTTGCKRTGCIYCGFGCHLEKEDEARFVLLKETHPKLYEYIMKPESEGGLGYKEKIDWINEHGNLKIRY